MKINLMIILVVLSTPCFSYLTYANASEDIELAHLMSNAQYFMHKVGLSIEAKNEKLAKFYAYELEEVIEEISEVETYDAFPIGQLTKTMLLPEFSALYDAINSANLKSAGDQYDIVINACNSCHMATKHEFIKIQRSDTNPYLQSFN